MNQANEYFLRAPEPEDLDFLYRLENDMTIWPVSDCHMPYSRYALKQYIASCPRDFFADKQLRLMVQPKIGGEAVAIADFFNFSALDGRAELGLIVDPAKRSQGIGQQALELVMEYAEHILGLRLLAVFIFADNASCCHLFLKNDFQQVATLPEWVVFDGKKHDVAVFCKNFAVS